MVTRTDDGGLIQGFAPESNPGQSHNQCSSLRLQGKGDGHICWQRQSKDCFPTTDDSDEVTPVGPHRLHNLESP